MDAIVIAGSVSYCYIRRVFEELPLQSVSTCPRRKYQRHRHGGTIDEAAENGGTMGDLYGHSQRRHD